MEVKRRPGAREAIFAQLVESGRAEQVAQRLTDAIILGVLTPGERLPSESELAKRFGVALITVREVNKGPSYVLREAGVEMRRARTTRLADELALLGHELADHEPGPPRPDPE